MREPMPHTIDERPYYERFDGVVRLKMPPLVHHAIVDQTMASILRALVAGRGFVLIEPHMRLGAADGTDTVFVPDIAYVSNERLASDYPGGNVVPDFAPDIAVEVRSPDTTERERRQKIAKYLACGTALVLDVDTEGRVILACTPDGSHSFASGTTLESADFPWLHFAVAEVFADLDRLVRLGKS
jgi:Uma2 family endonuclease